MAVEIPSYPNPDTLFNMSSRKIPLANNKNAANSPFRAQPAKAKRSFAHVQREEAYGQPPPAKRLMTEAHQSLRTPPRATQSNHAVPFHKRSNPAAFTKQLAAAKSGKQPQGLNLTMYTIENADEQGLENVRNWQRHYRQAFPDFVFYFESVPEEAKAKVVRQIAILNAREEKFFSNAVTHVITTKPLPLARPIPLAKQRNATTRDTQSQHDQPQTINPVLLDRSPDAALAQETHPLRSRFTFEAATSRKSNHVMQDAEIKRNHARNTDVLHRAQELGIKIWTWEKMQRVMMHLFEVDTGAQVQVPHNHNTRSNATHGGLSTQRLAATKLDLSQLLRNERINGPSDRDQSVVTKDMHIFKGPYIYIHDIDEKQRPIMVREYKKVAHKEDGDWPQFRSVANGRCPFVEEQDYTQRDAEKELLKQQRRQEREHAAAIPRTRAAAEAARMQPPKIAVNKRPLKEIAQGDGRRNATSIAQEIKPASHGASKKLLDVEPSSKGPHNAFVSHAAPGRLFRGEPVASGVQPSNITSAIRSQMVSSTAAAPGVKGGTSKEVYGLQRKVLEKNNAPASHASQQRLTSSHRMVDIAAAAREESTARVAKRKAQEKMGVITEERLQTAQEEVPRQAEVVRKSKSVHKRKPAKRDPKPGYCENCQDKFDDFEEHIQCRKHRKFAEKNENWKDLDALLRQLVRPLKHDDRSDDDDDDY